MKCIKVEVNGCDGTTEFVLKKVSIEHIAFLKSIMEACNAASNCQCQPTMSLSDWYEEKYYRLKNLFTKDYLCKVGKGSFYERSAPDESDDSLFSAEELQNYQTGSYELEEVK